MSTPARLRSQRGYDRLAAFYHPIEWLAFGGQLQRGRTALIDELPPWNRLLILGDGNGRLLERLIVGKNFVDQDSCHDEDSSQLRGDRRITSVDQSDHMLRLQRSRVEACGIRASVEFVQADACSFEPEADAFDVIVTPFFLDCFSAAELDACLPQWLRGLRPGGMLYHVDFIVPKLTWQRMRARSLLWAMHVFFRWQTGLENRRLVDIEAAIRRCGLCKELERVGGGGMIATQIWRRTLDG